MLLGLTATTAPLSMEADKEVVTHVDGKVFLWIETAARDLGLDFAKYKIEVTESRATVEVAFRFPPPPFSHPRGSPGGARNPNYVVTINKADGRVLERYIEK